MAGYIQAVQTLSRLNRAHPGKDTIYVLDFVNDATEVLASFKAYYATAELSGVTDPNLVYNLRAKLDASGQALNSEVIRRGIKDILLSHAKLWETLRGRPAA